jgi:hypothetical protein
VGGVEAAEFLSDSEDALIVRREPVGDEPAAVQAGYDVLAAEH